MIFPILAYTINCIVCFVCAAILFFFTGGAKELGGDYFRFLRVLGMLFLVIMPLDIVVIYSYVTLVNVDSLKAILVPVTALLCTYLLLHLFHLRIHTPRRFMHPLNIAVSIFVVVVMVYPILYSQYVMQKDTEFSLHSYSCYYATDVCLYARALIMAAAVSVGMVAVSTVYRSGRFCYNIRKSYLQDVKFGQVLLTCLCFLVMVGLMCYSNVIAPVPLYYDILLSSVFMIGVVIVQLNTKDRFVHLEKESMAYQLEYLCAMTPYMSSKDAAKQEDLSKEERAVVLRSIREWTQRTDKPFMRSDVTIESMAHDINLPVGIVRKYINWGYGQNFYEFIALLRNRD